MTFVILPATTLSATDARAARIKELQLGASPVFTEAIAQHDVAALFVFPPSRTG